MKLKKRAINDPRQVKGKPFLSSSKRTTFHEEAPILVWACFFLIQSNPDWGPQQKADPSLAVADLTIFAFSSCKRRGIVNISV
jgi:hypothetical protein